MTSISLFYGQHCLHVIETQAGGLAVLVATDSTRLVVVLELVLPKGRLFRVLTSGARDLLDKNSSCSSCCKALMEASR